MQPLLSKKNPTCLVALSDSTQMQQFDVVSNNSELHLFLFAYSKASFTRTQSFERQISVQMSILTPFQKKKNPCSYNISENAYPMLIHLHWDGVPLQTRSRLYTCVCDCSFKNLLG